MNDLAKRGWMTDWPFDSRSDQVHAEQLQDRERVQMDLQTAWDNVLWDIAKTSPGFVTKHRDDLKLIQWALGTK